MDARNNLEALRVSAWTCLAGTLMTAPLSSCGLAVKTHLISSGIMLLKAPFAALLVSALTWLAGIQMTGLPLFCGPAMVDQTSNGIIFLTITPFAVLVVSVWT